MYALSDNTAPRLSSWHYHEDPPASDASLAAHVAQASEDRPPYAVWVIASLVGWAFILAGFMAWDLNSTSRTIVWAIFGGWCIGVLSASIPGKSTDKAPQRPTR